METFESRLTTQILKNQQELIGLLLAARSEREERLRTGSLEDSTPSQKSKPVRSNPRRPNRASTPRRSDEELLRLRKRLQDEITREPGQSLRRYSENAGRFCERFGCGARTIAERRGYSKSRSSEAVRCTTHRGLFRSRGRFVPIRQAKREGDVVPWVQENRDWERNAHILVLSFRAVLTMDIMMATKREPRGL